MSHFLRIKKNVEAVFVFFDEFSQKKFAKFSLYFFRKIFALFPSKQNANKIEVNDLKTQI